MCHQFTHNFFAIKKSIYIYIYCFTVNLFISVSLFHFISNNLEVCILIVKVLHGQYKTGFAVNLFSLLGTSRLYFSNF